MQPKLSKSQLVLRAYAQQVNKLAPAYAVILEFCKAEVVTTKGTTDERKALVVAKFDAALAGLDNARDTLRVYLSNAIMIALVPNVTVKVKAEGAKIGEKATEELTVAKMASKRDMEKLAGAAREKLGIAKVKGSGRVAAPDAPPSNPQTAEAHVRAMVRTQPGRAMLMKWCAAEGYWLDFKLVEKDATAAPTEAPKPNGDATPPAKPKGKARKEQRVS